MDTPVDSTVPAPDVVVPDVVVPDVVVPDVVPAADTATPVSEVSTSTAVLDSTANPTDPVAATATVVDDSPVNVKAPALVEHAFDMPGADTTTDAAVSGGATDDVHFASCVFKNAYARKSLTIHHLQRRLNALGFADAYADEDGFYGDLTKLSIQNFQVARGLPISDVIDSTTFAEIFRGDANVVVIID